jgi:hypothetical protein
VLAWHADPYLIQPRITFIVSSKAALGFQRTSPALRAKPTQTEARAVAREGGPDRANPAGTRPRRAVEQHRQGIGDEPDRLIRPSRDDRRGIVGGV